MTARYLQIMAAQDPFDPGLTELGRAELIFNIDIVKVYSETVEEELVKILTDASVGTANVNIFAGSGANIPAKGDGPYLSIIVQGGAGPDRTHNQISPPAYSRPSAQIFVRGKTYTATRTMAFAAMRALEAVRNTTITP